MPDRTAARVTEEDLELLFLEPSRVTLVAQPIVDLRRAVVVGYEALSRFTLGKPAPPDLVFAVSARAGVAEELEALVIERALGLASSTPPNCFLTINVDPHHLLSNRIWGLLDARRDLSRLVFELTEHRSIEDVPAVQRAVQRLRSRGAFTALDDAGSGYSGLKQILDLRPQFLKVDRDLITEVHESEAKRALIQMLGELAGRLDAWLLAEGIETESELHAIGQLGVPLGQGYFLGRPAPPWSSVEPTAERALRKRHERRVSGTTLDGLVEPCMVCEADSPWPETPRTCVRLGPGSRPVGMRVLVEDEARERSGTDLLRVKRDSPLTEIALRASSRAERTRWDPLVCVDERGAFEGIIPMQRVVAALAVHDEEATATPPASIRAGDLRFLI